MKEKPLTKTEINYSQESELTPEETADALPKETIDAIGKSIEWIKERAKLAAWKENESS